MSREREEQVVPIVEEQLHVGRRTRETGGLVIDKKVVEREEVVSEPVIVEEADVRRVRIDRVVDQPPHVREENGELVIPLLEEVLVVEKRLMLREELRIRRTRSESAYQKAYTLRSEVADIQRREDREKRSQK